jgi:S-phase kinase-associated protein 1
MNTSTMSTTDQLSLTTMNATTATMTADTATMITDTAIVDATDAKMSDDGLDMSDDDQIVNLISKDDIKFTINKKNCCMSVLVQTAINENSVDNVVPILSVNGKILEIIVTYMNHHQGIVPPEIEKPLKDKNLKNIINEWDAKFIDTVSKNQQQLYDLILAANYMHIESLLHLGCAKIASLIKGEPLEKIKEILAV